MSKSYSHRSITLAPHPLYKVTHLSNQPLPRASPTLPLPPPPASFQKRKRNWIQMICLQYSITCFIITFNPGDFIGVKQFGREMEQPLRGSSTYTINCDHTTAISVHVYPQIYRYIHILASCLTLIICNCQQGCSKRMPASLGSLCSPLPPSLRQQF